LFVRSVWVVCELVCFNFGLICCVGFVVVVVCFDFVVVVINLVYSGVWDCVCLGVVLTFFVCVWCAVLSEFISRCRLVCVVGFALFNCEFDLVNCGLIYFASH
jgi:hypothetical protein